MPHIPTVPSSSRTRRRTRVRWLFLSFTLDAAATPITVTGPDNTYATGQTVSAVSSVTDADETWEYQLIDGNTVCDSTTTGTFTAYTAGSATHLRH